MNKTLILKLGHLRPGGYLIQRGKVMSNFQKEPPAPPSKKSHTQSFSEMQNNTLFIACKSVKYNQSSSREKWPEPTDMSCSMLKLT